MIVKQAESVMSSARKKVDVKSGRIGLISDTHGLIRPEALAALRGTELILHAGDIGKPEVLEALRNIAPVIAIRGNNDRGSWARDIPDRVDLAVNGLKFHLIHDLNDLDFSSRARYDAVISGHSHQPRAVIQDRVQLINPGSAGPRRFKLPITVGRLQITGKKMRATIVDLLTPQKLS
jgi:putative phosphoesterase